MALANKIKGNNKIGVVFIGDGTLGEGVLYETLNIVSKWKIPLLIVLENNYYAQSTPQSLSLAGDILSRPKAFGIKTFENSTEHYEELFKEAKISINYVREKKKPAFHLVNTYRLAAHSTGDDNRDSKEIKSYLEKDSIHLFSKKKQELYSKIVTEVNQQIHKAIDVIKIDKEQTLEEYFNNPETDLENNEVKWNEIIIRPSSTRLINKINEAFLRLLDEHDDILFIGEDIHSPYGGAFKATKDLSENHPDKVFTTPISEGAITGIANGLALKGFRPFLEIMFGDFITLTLDQIINHASKFYHMYNKQVNCPIVIRTPMGGKRGFGPTHSQTLDKFLIGIDNIKVIAINILISPLEIYMAIYENERHPVIVLENKIDYARKFQNISADIIKNYKCISDNSIYPTLRFVPKVTKPEVTIITYGGSVHDVFEASMQLFNEKEIVTEIIILSQIYPLPIKNLQSAIGTDFLFVVEEGSKSAGFGSELIANLAENNHKFRKVKRVASLPIPVPSSKKLESQVLSNPNQIVNAVDEVFNGD